MPGGSQYSQKKLENEFTGGVIDNSGLDAAILDNLMPEEYPLEELDFDLIADWEGSQPHGTIIVFEGLKENIKNTVQYLKKMLAMSFRFALIDKDFSIYVNDEMITVSDLQDLLSATQFIWSLNDYKDEFIDSCTNIAEGRICLYSDLTIGGFLATVRKPSNLKIRGADERATVDLFVNGRLREKNILRHIPTQRITESYLYGHISFQ